MRVATLSIYNGSKYQLAKTLSDYNEANATVSTGKKIRSPADDPVGYVRVMQLNSSLAQMDQIGRNITTGLSWLNNTETTLSSAQDTILEAKQLAISMNNDSMSEDDLETAAENAQQLLYTLIDYANTKVNGQYIFAGTKTDTVPYTLDESTDPPTVTYSGNDSAFTISTGVSSRTEVGTPGSSVFGDTTTGDDIFSLMIALQEDLADNGGANLDSIIGELETQYNNVVDAISVVGIKTERLETKESVISDVSATFTTSISNLEDADLATAAADLAAKKTAYQASLSATSAIMSLSLVDYM
jgi:flagellar hook-associated protein 3 FlgL